MKIALWHIFAVVVGVCLIVSPFVGDTHPEVVKEQKQ